MIFLRISPATYISFRSCFSITFLSSTVDGKWKDHGDKDEDDEDIWNGCKWSDKKYDDGDWKDDWKCFDGTWKKKKDGKWIAYGDWKDEDDEEHKSCKWDNVWTKHDNWYKGSEKKCKCWNGGWTKCESLVKEHKSDCLWYPGAIRVKNGNRHVGSSMDCYCNDGKLSDCRRKKFLRA